ncbi:MAG: S41 family peptidase [Lachnospiraceae bacterium]|nr:S41 family peptidase [Lachnospiraceae bacterium]
MEQDNSKRSYFLGLFTGCIICAFIICVIVIIRIITATDKSQVSAVSPPTPAASSGKVYAASVSQDGPLMDDPMIERKISALEELIDKEFIDSVSNNALEIGIYDGIMSALDDPYAAYYTPEEYLEMQRDTQGIYYGIGAYLQKDTDTLYPRISGVIKNTPAEEQGLQEDDYITKVEGEDTFDWELDEVVKRIRGPENTSVHITISRKENGSVTELEKDVTRRKVETPTVEYEKKEKGIAYISISEFDVVTIDQFAEALAEARGDGMKGLVLDLRSNPGGSLRAVVDIASMMLPKGRVVYTEDKYGRQQSYDCDGRHEIDVPMVVLVNGNSASASEILAGAIKDYKKGTIMGTTTFGKGIVQQIFPLTDGSAVKLTVSHYYTPNGNDIHKKGIEPDIEVKFDSEAYQKDKSDNQLDEAIKELEKKLGN